MNQYARFENLTSYVASDSSGGYDDYPPLDGPPGGQIGGGDGFGGPSGPPPMPPPATDVPF